MMCHRKLLKASCMLFLFILQFNTTTRSVFHPILKMPHLNKYQISKTIGTIRAMSYKAVAAHFNVDRKTIEWLISK